MSRIEISHLQGMSPEALRVARKHVADRAREIHQLPDGQLRDKTPEESDEFRHAMTVIDWIDEHLEFDKNIRSQLRDHPRSMVRASESSMPEDRAWVNDRDGSVTRARQQIDALFAGPYAAGLRRRAVRAASPVGYAG